MICSSISFCNYRNISLETVFFSEGVNVLWGDNAQGKSNILEGIYFFARGRSFRGARERELIRFGEKTAQLSLTFQKENASYPVTLEADLPQVGKKVLRRGGARLSGVREMIGQFSRCTFLSYASVPGRRRSGAAAQFFGHRPVPAVSCIFGQSLPL